MIDSHRSGPVKLDIDSILSTKSTKIRNRRRFETPFFTRYVPLKALHENQVKLQLLQKLQLILLFGRGRDEGGRGLFEAHQSALKMPQNRWAYTNALVTV